MDNPGDYTLFAGSISSTLSRSTGMQTPVVNLEGVSRLTILANFKYGSGGAAAPNGCSAIVQVAPSVDTSTWFDVCRIDFAQANRIYRRNLEVQLSVGADYADLASEGFFDGMLFSQVRAMLLVGATPYVNNTTLSLIIGVS